MTGAPSPQPLRLTITSEKRAVRDLEEEAFTSAELVEIISACPVGEKDGPAIIPALFNPCPPRCHRHGIAGSDCGGNRPHRLRRNVRAMTGFAADIDNVTAKEMEDVIDRVQAMGLEFTVWETHGHDPEAVERGEARGRYRMLIPFNAPLPLNGWEQWSKGAWLALMQHFGVRIGDDDSCSDPSRIYFTQRKPTEDTPREYLHNPGRRFDPSAVLGTLDALIPPKAAVDLADFASEDEDPTRPVDLEAVKVRMLDTPNPTTKELARKAVKGEPLEKPNGAEGRTMSRHEAWWKLCGRLSMAAEPWMSTEALLEILRPSWEAERTASPDDFTEWDDGRDSVVEIFAMQRASAPAQKAQREAERKAWRDGARNALNQLLQKRGRPELPSETPEQPAPPEEEEHPAEAPTPTPASWTVEEVQASLEVKISSTGARTYPGTLQNITTVMSSAPEWAGAFRLNKLTSDFEVWPCSALGNDKPERFSETLITEIRLALSTSEAYPMKAAKDEVIAVAEMVAKGNPYEPVQDYLNSLKWDGISRLAGGASGAVGWLVRYMKARVTSDDGADLTGYLDAIGKRWMISAVARAYQPGCQADSMLQIEGAQGAGKSSALKILGGEFYMDSTSDFESKDTAILLATAWLSELGELSSFSRASESVQKSFITRRVDSIVRKYERYRTDLPRRCVMAGTTNLDQYLTDDTGNRRHWTFSVDGKVDLDGLKRDRDQLWAEAVHLYRANEQWHLTDDEAKLAKLEAAKRVRGDMVDELIEAWFRRTSPERRARGVLPADIAREVLEDNRGATKKNVITGALRRLGFVNKAMRIGGQVVKRWATPAEILHAPHEPHLAATLKEQMSGAGSGVPAQA